MPSRAGLVTRSILYGLGVCVGTFLLGFVLVPILAYVTGFLPIWADAQGVFSLLTLKSLPILFGLSGAAAFSYETVIRLSLARRAAVYVATVVVSWVVGSTVAALALG